MYSQIKELRQVLEEQGIIAEDPSMLAIFQNAYHLASMDTTVLIYGASGVGKDRIAKFIHANSQRRNRPFLHINCSAVPQELFEAELFGYEAGTFTGGLHAGKQGLLEAASGGTLFLDEVGEMSLQNQVKLLDFLQNKQITRLGGGVREDLDVRIISATNRDLRSEVRAGRFREDFYYRICVVALQIPPLRERPRDIAAFAARFMADGGNGDGLELTADALAYLQEQKWPGNLRELQNLMERVCIFGAGEKVTRSVLEQNHTAAPAVPEKPEGQEGHAPHKTLREAVDACKRACISEAIQETSTLEEAAAWLGISLDLLHREKRRLGIYKRWRR